VEKDYDFDAANRHVGAHLAEVLRRAPDAIFSARLEPSESLFALFLDNLPPEHRRSHDCSCCRSFFKRYAAAVVVNERGVTSSALFGQDAPGIYGQAFEYLRIRLADAEVGGVIKDAATTWGTPQTGTWTHFAVPAPVAARDVPRGLTPGQHRAALRELNRTFAVAINTTWTRDTLERGLALLRSGTLYRGDRFVPQAEFLLRVKAEQEAVRGSRKRKNLLWAEVVKAPAGFATPRSTALGTLLDDVQTGLPQDQIKRKFDAMLAPENFRRVQTAPTASALQQAERLVEQMGLAPALARRYARLDELPLRWRPEQTQKYVVLRKTSSEASGGVFAGVTPRGGAAPATPDMRLPPVTMTWEKFSRTVLPEAVALQALVPPSSARFAALVTAADPAATPLLLWDRPEARNPVSWYYGAGVDGEMRRRVTEAGGQYDDVDVRASLMWNNRNDLDLHCQTPAGQHIYYGSKRDTTGGYLDVDMNVSGETTKPVENIRWPRGTARPGRYRFSVWNFRHHEHRRPDTPFTLELAVGGRTYAVQGVVHSSSIQHLQIVAEFELGRDGKLVGEPCLHGTAQERPAGEGGATNGWGLVPGALVPVTGIVDSPNLWGDCPVTAAGRHVFLLLAGCRDEQPGVGRGFFNEHLLGELRPARKALEAYAAQAVIAGGADATACGLGFTDQSPWDVTLRATLLSGTRDYKIDRWD
jgi:hypothetical protein